MGFCQKCGSKLADGAQFCPDCGTKVGTAGIATPVPPVPPVPNETNNNETVRKQVFVGEKRKCPHCGETINGYVAVCPSCGNQLNTKVNADIKKFAEELKNADVEIANYYENNVNQQKKWWSSWGIGKKILYVILNIYTICIPVIIHFLSKAIGIITGAATKKMNPAEQKKASLIMNAIVPNEMDGIMEFLNFASSQRDLDQISMGINDVSLLWKTVWNNKIQQIITKSESLYSSDTQFMNLIGQKKKEIAEIKKTIRIKKFLPVGILGIAALACVLGFAFISNGGGTNISAEEKHKVINKSDISISGSLANFIEFTDSDVEIMLDESSGDTILKFEIVAKTNLSEAIEKQTVGMIKEKGWNTADCEKYKALDFYYYDSDIKVNSELIYSWEDTLKSIINLTEGETKKVRFTISDSSALTKSGRKKFSKKMLTEQDYEIYIGLGYRIYHSTSDGNDRIEITIK